MILVAELLVDRLFLERGRRRLCCFDVEGEGSWRRSSPSRIGDEDDAEEEGGIVD